MNKKDWILTTPYKKSKNPLKHNVDIISSQIKYDDISFKFARKFDSKYFTSTITQINEDNVEDITMNIVYNDGDEENFSFLQIRVLKKNSK